MPIRTDDPFGEFVDGLRPASYTAVGLAGFNNRCLRPADSLDPGVDYREWREAGPVQRVEFPGGLQVWAVTRYREVLALLRDDRFTRDWRAVPSPAFDYGSRRYPEDYFATPHSTLFNSEGADHQRLLRLAMPFLTRDRVRKMQPVIEEVVRTVVAPLADRERVDLVAEFAVPIPLQVIGRVLGVRDGLLPEFAEHLHVTSGWLDPADERWQSSSRALHRLALQAMNDPDAIAGDCLIGALIEAYRGRGAITRVEIGAMIVILIATGYETTAALLANGSLVMVTDPAARRQMVGDGVESAVAELLRWQPPSPWGQLRIARRDLTFAGVDITEGDLVYPVFPAANRDPRVFTDPEVLDLARDEADHLSFGQGKRRCIGSWLARAIATTALPALARHLPPMRVSVPVDQLRWHGLLHVRALQALPVHRTAAASGDGYDHAGEAEPGAEAEQ
ncbi:cytochrome P450 [Catenulispora rubra]|uniref:cytochrome P450 n=1 Tax=Catenulispora rubra TaxID=280293 RepID=UPI001891FB9F|nr:cytochrome P450 [Catenulispora rubra]